MSAAGSSAAISDGLFPCFARRGLLARLRQEVNLEFDDVASMT
jgi:hypothetical protein